MKILIVAPNWIGDAIMAEPLYHFLKQRFPSAQLEVLAPDWTHPLLNRMSAVDKAIAAPFTHGQLSLSKRWKLGQKLKQNHYHQAIILPNSLKSALIPFFANIPRRTGYKGEQRYLLLNDIRKLDTQALPRLVDRYLALANDDHSLPSSRNHPVLNIDSEQQTIRLAKFGLSTSQPIAVFCIGAEYGPAKRWPAQHFASLAKKMAHRGYQIWLFGSAKEVPISESITHLIDKPTQAILYNLCGKTTLDEAIDLMSAAQVVVSNDSGLMHMAAALNLPLVALYGSSSYLYTPPLSTLAEVLSLNLPCSPCFQRECPLVHFNCMQQLTADTVIKAIDRVLALTPPTS